MEIPKFNISVHCPTSQETKMNNIVWLLFILDLYFFWYLLKGRLEGEEVHRITDIQNAWARGSVRTYKLLDSFFPSTALPYRRLCASEPLSPPSPSGWDSLPCTISSGFLYWEVDSRWCRIRKIWHGREAKIRLTGSQDGQIRRGSNRQPWDSHF